MRLTAVVMAGLLVGSGCAANSYKVPHRELERLALTPPEQRGNHVRVIQEISATDVPPAERVDDGTQIVLVPEVHVSTGVSVGGGGRGGGGGGLGAPKLGKGSKDEAIAYLVLAAVALVAIAGVEGSRFDGWAQLHPMHPVHLIGHDGQFQTVPLAWLDPQQVAWADRAVIRPNEGPWHPLERAPLSREGLTYGMYGGHSSFKSAYGDVDNGPAFTVQAGYFPTQEIGLLFSVFAGWRDNQDNNTLFDTRTTLELQAMPIKAGIFHAGLYGGGGIAYRVEDFAGTFSDRSPGTGVLTGGTMLQLDVNTRIAITARIGLARARGEEMHDLAIGLSVY